MLDLILFNTHDLILMITVFQCILFSIVIFFLRPKSTLSNVLLAGFLISTAAIPLDTLTNYGAGVHDWMLNNHPGMFYIFEFGYWTQGAFLLWYVRSILYKNFKLDAWDLLYLVPFTFYFSHQLISYHLLSAETKILIQTGQLSAEQNNSIFFITFFREFLRVFFAASCVLEIRRFCMQIKNRQHNETPSYAWLQYSAYIFLGLCVWSFTMSALILMAVEIGFSIDVGVFGLLSNYAVCLFISLFVLLVSNRTSMLNSLEKLATVGAAAQAKPVNHEHIRTLEALMEKEKPYLEHNLTLDSLSEKSGMAPRLLSTVINRHYGYNFFEFVNHYRINEAKRMLLAPEYSSTTVLDIMYNCGFNSKATFNNFFKKFEGMTPREYKKQNATQSPAKSSSHVQDESLEEVMLD